MSTSSIQQQLTAAAAAVHHQNHLHGCMAPPNSPAPPHSTDLEQVATPTSDVEQIRRLKKEVHCLKKSLNSVGQTNRGSKEWIVLKSKLDAAKEELGAVLEDQQLLTSISPESSPTLSSRTPTSTANSPPESPLSPRALPYQSDNLTYLQHELKRTPKWSLPWFEIKRKIDAEKEKYELNTLQNEYDQIISDEARPVRPPPPPRRKNKSDITPLYPVGGPLSPGNLKMAGGNKTSAADDRSTSCGTSSSSPSRDARTNNNNSNKLDVTITVVSVDGIVARRYESKTKLSTTQWKKNDKKTSCIDTATVVASFSQTLSGQEFLTHLPSDPFEVETSLIQNRPIDQNLVQWPDTDDDDDDEDEEAVGSLSTFQCSKSFQLERADAKSSKKRFIPQSCPISISMSRNGKLVSLGKANLIITGEERGGSSVVPITIAYPKSKGKMKKFRKGNSSNQSSVPMMRIKGDNVQFGLKSDAMLRVFVTVRDGRSASSTQKVPDNTIQILKLKPAAALHFDPPTENDYESESVEEDSGQDEVSDKSRGMRGSKNVKTESLQTDKKLQKMKAHNMESLHIQTKEATVPIEGLGRRNVKEGKGARELRESFTSVSAQRNNSFHIDDYEDDSQAGSDGGDKNVKTNKADSSSKNTRKNQNAVEKSDQDLQTTVTLLKQQNRVLVKSLASISEEKDKLESTLTEERTKLQQREKLESEREKKVEGMVSALQKRRLSADTPKESSPNMVQKTSHGSDSTTTSTTSWTVDSSQALDTIPVRRPLPKKSSKNAKKSQSDGVKERERALRNSCPNYEEGGVQDAESVISDESLATSVLNEMSAGRESRSEIIQVKMMPMKEGPTKPKKCKCTSLNFDIAEFWIHKGMDYHLIQSHVRPSGLNESMWEQIQNVYQGEDSDKRTHRLSLSMCKWAKKTGGMLWITEHQTPRLAQALKYSISGVQLGVAVPVRHENVYATILFFSMTSTIMEPFAPGAEEYLSKMSHKIVAKKQCT
jgi:hypothetical protein